jgi:hypothetical protein
MMGKAEYRMQRQYWYYEFTENLAVLAARNLDHADTKGTGIRGTLIS